MIQKLSLKTRKFIGTTSMDPQLSLIMANQAQVKNGDIILDPFVGTGSLLVAASQFGGFIMGTDIDYMMLHARTRPTRINQTVIIVLLQYLIYIVINLFYNCRREVVMRVLLQI